jgi:hypothetical protein
MKTIKKLVPLKRIILSSLGKSKTEKYLLGIEIQYENSVINTDTVNIYQDALVHLVNSDMEKAINYIVFGLDVNRNDRLLFNLCKNMVFILSQHLAENNADFLKQKYGTTLEKAFRLIQNKLKEYEKKLESLYSELEEMEEEVHNSKPTFFSFNKLYLLYYFKKKKLTPQIQSLKTNIDTITKKVNKLAQDVDKIEKLTQIEEHISVLRIVLDVCIFPAKFEYALLKTDKPLEKQPEEQLQN